MDKDKPAEKSGDQTRLLLMVAIVAALAAPFMAALMAIQTISGKIEKLAPKSTATAVGENGQPVEGAGAPKEQHMAFYEPMEFLVNLADSEACHYLRATVSLGCQVEGVEKAGGGGHGEKKEGPKPELFVQLKAQEPVIRDVVISVISAYTMNALIATKGKNELKDMIRARLQQQLKTDNLEVYFSAFTLQ